MIETERLVLRPWRADDREPFAALNADPRVMEHFPETLTREASDAMVDRMEGAWREHGFCFAAMERTSDGVFVGMAGLARVPFRAPFTPAVEIGWRLAQAHWGMGYASEAARAWLEYGFAVFGLAEIVSFTTTTNLRSQAVMQRIGMQRDASRDFEHPSLEPGHPLRSQVLYALGREAWAVAGR
jgi:ribosomal-protein-alanine N-acetyltransferase